MCLCVKLTMGQLYWQVLYVNLTQTVEKGSFSWGNASIRSSCEVLSQLMINGARPIVGGAIHGLVVFSSIKKKAEFLSYFFLDQVIIE